MRRALLAASLALLAAACSDKKNLVPLDWDSNRMTNQPRYTDFDAGPGFRNGMVLQSPPAGTVPRELLLGPLPLTLGVDEAGNFAQQLPIAMPAELVELGRNRFDRTCAACHGILGTSDAEVATKMPLRTPPSLHLDSIRAYPPGRLYQVVTFGYGIMPAYALQLTVEERWAVVAYVRALQLSQHAPLASLPPPLQQKFHSEVP